MSYVFIDTKLYISKLQCIHIAHTHTMTWKMSSIMPHALKQETCFNCEFYAEIFGKKQAKSRGKDREKKPSDETKIKDIIYNINQLREVRSHHYRNHMQWKHFHASSSLTHTTSSTLWFDSHSSFTFPAPIVELVCCRARTMRSGNPYVIVNTRTINSAFVLFTTHVEWIRTRE